MIYCAIENSVGSKMRLRNSGVAPLLSLILFYRKSIPPFSLLSSASLKKNGETGKSVSD